ncbi:Peptidase C50, separase [Trema orientale]|uniref:separase n=1 Tax=Trema orientale TaxID=63057 RepID=A0A2P5BAZ0_TREOI|nr:Peptidase C50, separase [Trema orientale]
MGPWKYVLVGEECQGSKQLDPVHKKLVFDLKSKSKMDVNESILKLILGGLKDISSEQRMTKYFGVMFGEGSRSNGFSTGLSSAGQTLMLPWESIPILRKEEVYRMPSVWSISSRLDRRSHHNPFIDPLDAFYVLNPSGDLINFKTRFENWFRDQNLEEKVGCAPTSEELALALTSHDLFLYVGHGSVTTDDVNQFGTAILAAMLKERSSPSDLACAKCNNSECSHKFANANKRVQRKKLPQASSRDNNFCHHRPTIGSFIGEARETCSLPLLNGAAAVCYGLPTSIKRNKDL